MDHVGLLRVHRSPLADFILSQLKTAYTHPINETERQIQITSSYIIRTLDLNPFRGQEPRQISRTAGYQEKWETYTHILCENSKEEINLGRSVTLKQVWKGVGRESTEWINLA